MSLTPMDRLRRRIGLLFLSSAAGMTWLGLGWFDQRLRGVVFLLYWAVGAGCALCAFACALVDMRVMRQRMEAERRALPRASFSGAPRAVSRPSQPEG